MWNSFHTGDYEGMIAEMSASPATAAGTSAPIGPGPSAAARTRVWC